MIIGKRTYSEPEYRFCTWANFASHSYSQHKFYIRNDPNFSKDTNQIDFQYNPKNWLDRFIKHRNFNNAMAHWKLQ